MEEEKGLTSEKSDFDKKQDQVNFTTPNKCWDGLASGLPSLACWCEETEKYVVKHGIGWRFDSILSNRRKV